MEQETYDNFTWAKSQEGYEHIVQEFKENNGRVENLPEECVILDDSYFADYKNHYKEYSDIKEGEYIPKISTLVEASRVGRDEPHKFYKVIAKMNDRQQSLYASTYDASCKVLFVRTEYKQIKRKAIKITLKVEADYYDRIKAVAEAKDMMGNLNPALIVMADKSAMDAIWEDGKVRFHSKRASASQYTQYKNAQTRAKRQKMATPKWSCKYAIKAMKEEVARRNRVAGFEKWHLDHQYPLHLKRNGEWVGCGLHAPHNLKIMLATDNLRKSNRFDSVPDIG